MHVGRARYRSGTEGTCCIRRVMGSQFIAKSVSKWW